MRWTMAISVALLLALGAYAGSAAVSLDRLVQAVQSRDAAAVMSRTDLPRLKRSLVDQIVAAYLNRIGQKRAVKPLERLAANTYGASIADVIAGKLLTQERLTELLNSGKVSLDASYLGRMGQLERILHPFQGGMASNSRSCPTVGSGQCDRIDPYALMFRDVKHT